MPRHDRIAAYYSQLVSALGRPAATFDIVAVAHMVPNTLTFAPALAKIGNLAAILPKPKSVGRPEYAALQSDGFKLLPLSRTWATDPIAVVDSLREVCPNSGRSLVLVDIGGYFAESVDQIASMLNGRLVGVLEGTENGVQKYERQQAMGGALSVPIATVARSPLKLPEDYLVASSIVFSIEATLRQEVEILQTRTATVIGYGRVGSAVAEILRSRGISTAVFDTDPIPLAEAAARGFRAYTRRSDALLGASLVVCATGNRSLDLKGFAMLSHGCVVASTTSADDEFDLSALSGGYLVETVNERMTRYKENRSGDGGRHFFLIAEGNAANFMDGAVIGPAMQLIEGEKLAAIRGLMDGSFAGRSGIVEVPRETQQRVAEIWNHQFLDRSTR